ncbi:DNA repair protein REV1 isoform X2 [Ceratina calcarata]|uniref:DNA repair protein REV1 n=1 Tax=Ceratina calcarata TaxID=156304 RepID=A0AAJ7J964_9HYME|nr:DNA repair protein REV1 isoform X2 [Ceratina calcarata]
MGNYLLYSQCSDVQPALKYIVTSKENKTNFPVRNTTKKDKVDSSENDNNDKIEIPKESMMKPSTSNSAVPMNSRETNSTKNSEFISEFYSHSRLHHISTMGATFKEYVNELRDKSTGKFPGLDKLKVLRNSTLNESLLDSQSSFYLQEDNRTQANQSPIIMHIDMDCFFVSVGLRDRPELKGFPVAVTHAKGNRNFSSNSKQTLDNKDEEHGSLSEVASCSYEARKAGVKNGMFLGEALKICPNLKTIAYNFEGYTEVSYMLYDTVASYTLDIEAVSCDEMYADCTQILQASGLTPMEFATVIRHEIKGKTGCPVSTGFGSNKLLARLATKKAKPNGQFYIQQGHINDCINTLNVQDLPGVGWSTTHKLNSINIRTCAELQTISLATLQKDFGKKTGELLYNICRGIDNSKLNLEHVRKSVSAEVNYGIRFESDNDAIDFLKKLSCEVCNRLSKANAKGRCITLKLLIRAKEAPRETEKFMGHGMCDYMTKSKNLVAPINDVEIVTKEVIALWNQMQKPPEDARGIGIQISRLEILKSKARSGTIINFINKNKQDSKINKSNEINKNNETQFLTNANTDMSDSGIGSVNTELKLHVSSGISESVLSELPEDIQNEILDINKSKSMTTDNKDTRTVNIENLNKKSSEKNIQTRQDNFFKQTKSGISRPAKVEMPPIQDIDMSVLIELPESIRNEILNEYSATKNRDQNNVTTNQNSASSSSINNEIPAEINRDEQNISFSQVDPEFLAALSEDLRRDVQMYCTSKKAECSKNKTDEATRNIGLLNVETKKPEQKNKNGKNGKIILQKSKKKHVKTVIKSTKTVNDCENMPDIKKSNIKSLIPSVTKQKSNDQITAAEAEAILSHNRTIAEDNDNMNPHQNVLISLVNRLLNLPLEQVKMQIQMWITNSNIINEVDFLSLATFLSMLPEKKRIEDLHVLLKTMHRCMTKSGNCIWHRTYRKTVKYVQHYMQIEYNSNLMVPPIKCNLLQCNNDVM